MDVFIVKFTPNGKNFIFATYLGSSGFDTLGGLAVDGQGVVGVTGGAGGGLYREAWGGIALDSAGGIYVVGSTNSPDFSVLKAYQKALAGDYDAFVLKFRIGD